MMTAQRRGFVSAVVNGGVRTAIASGWERCVVFKREAFFSTAMTAVEPALTARRIPCEAAEAARPASALSTTLADRNTTAIGATSRRRGHGKEENNGSAERPTLTESAIPKPDYLLPDRLVL